MWDRTVAALEMSGRRTRDCLSLSADKQNMRQALIRCDELRPTGISWALLMKGVSRAEPIRLVKCLTGAIHSCGGWVLSRSASERGLIEILFEFERRSCVEVYSTLVVAGVELSQAAHLRFTELCQCTWLSHRDCGDEIVSVDLQVQTLLTVSDQLAAMRSY
jgi:hypothetical protein